MVARFDHIRNILQELMSNDEIANESCVYQRLKVAEELTMTYAKRVDRVLLVSLVFNLRTLFSILVILGLCTDLVLDLYNIYTLFGCNLIFAVFYINCDSIILLKMYTCLVV
jgi:hypothetical protein